MIQAHTSHIFCGNTEFHWIRYNIYSVQWMAALQWPFLVLICMWFVLWFHVYTGFNTISHLIQILIIISSTSLTVFFHIRYTMAELLWTAKWVFGGAIFLASIEILHCWWRINKRNRIPLHINEVFFVMSNQSGDNLRCFCNVYQTNMQQATACPNPHCKAKLLNKIVAHMNSAQHLICIAMSVKINH